MPQPENLKPGACERHGGYLFVNRGVIRETNRDIAAALEELEAHLIDYVGGEPDAVQALLLDAIIPTWGFRKLIERHCFREGALVQEGKRMRVSAPLREAYWGATNSMVRAAKALAETVGSGDRVDKALDLSAYLRQKAEAAAK